MLNERSSIYSAHRRRMKDELSLNLNDYIWKILRGKLLSSLENKGKGFNSSKQSLDEQNLKKMKFPDSKRN